METIERDFKGVWIPKEIWLDKRLNALDKVILTEIDSLDSSERGCWASNKHIAEFCQCSETKVSTAISKLIKYDYLYVQSFDGRQRELKSRLTKFERQHLKDYKADFKSFKTSNTTNNINNKTDNNIKEEAKTINDILDTIEEPTLIEPLKEFIKMRKAIKKPMTTRAFELILNKLNKLAVDTSTQIKILEQSILNGWQDVYALKSNKDDFTERMKIKEQQLNRNYSKNEFDNLFDDISKIEI